MYSFPKSQDALVFMLNQDPTVYCNMTVPSCLSGRLSIFKIYLIYLNHIKVFKTSNAQTLFRSSLVNIVQVTNTWCNVELQRLLR